MVVNILYKEFHISGIVVSFSQNYAKYTQIQELYDAQCFFFYFFIFVYGTKSSAEFALKINSNKTSKKKLKYR